MVLDFFRMFLLSKEVTCIALQNLPEFLAYISCYYYACGRVRMTEDRDKWRKYVHGVANPRIKDA